MLTRMSTSRFNIEAVRLNKHQFQKRAVSCGSVAFTRTASTDQPAGTELL